MIRTVSIREVDEYFDSILREVNGLREAFDGKKKKPEKNTGSEESGSARIRQTNGGQAPADKCLVRQAEG